MCTPIRTLRSIGSGHGSARSASCASTAAATALPARENTAPKPSPPVENTWPSAARTALRRISSWRTSASRISAGCLSHSGVDPTMSVNRNDTVPVGRRSEPFPDTSDVSSLASPGMTGDCVLGRLALFCLRGGRRHVEVCGRHCGLLRSVQTVTSVWRRRYTRNSSPHVDSCSAPMRSWRSDRCR